MQHQCIARASIQIETIGHASERHGRGHGGVAFPEPDTDSLARLPGWLKAFLGQPVSPPATGNTVPVI